MKEEFLKHLSTNRLCSIKDKILLAVSGGIDSMVMLHLFQKIQFDICVAHVNFQLRGKESDEEELFVENYCNAHSVPFLVTRFNTSEYAEKNSVSTQMAARELRYTWFEKLINENKFDFVATAHHLNDSIETTLLNFTRGTSIDGMDGIPLKNGKIIRPMLFATREQIEVYAQENKVPWREDSSNSTDDYQRNFIRHKVVPLLKELNPSLEKSFNDATEKIGSAGELLLLGATAWREKFEARKNNQIHLAKKGFENSSAGLLWNLIKTYGFNLDQCRQIISSINGQSGKHFSSHEFELTVDRDYLIIVKKENAFGEVQIQKGESEVQVANYLLRFEETHQAKISKDPWEANLDLSKLAFPLTWRKWKAGDSFHPLGMDHKKKLSDFFIDLKIPLADKEKITVLESGNEIVWVIGYRIDDRYKIQSGSKQPMLRVTFTTSGQ